MNTPKLQLADSLQDVMFKMSEGNPGALNVCLQILKDSKQIDPENVMGGIGTLLSLDTLGLYGSQIWMLYKDVCGENLSKMLAVVRGWQLGFVSDTEVRYAVENYGDGINLEELCSKVVKMLPRFKLT